MAIISAPVSPGGRCPEPPPIQLLVLRRRSIDVFSLISSAFGGCSRPVLVGALAPWIGMMGSTSTLVRQDHDLVALPAQRPWSSASCCAPRPFYLRNTWIAANFVAHPNTLFRCSLAEMPEVISTG
jgi:hypothetical protein